MAGRRRRQRGVKSYDLAMVVVAVGVVVLARAGDWVREDLAIAVGAAVVLLLLLLLAWRWYAGRRRRFATTVAGFLALDPTGFDSDTPWTPVRCSCHLTPVAAAT